MNIVHTLASTTDVPGDTQMNQKRIQTRGHCQCCGHVQATGYTVAKHGYTVDFGYFSGVCHGAFLQPLERDRSHCDATILDLRRRAPEDEAFADLLQAGAVLPIKGYVRSKTEWDKRTGGRKKIPVSFGSLSINDQGAQVSALIFNLRRGAEFMRTLANDIGQLADRVHGQPLLQVEVQASAQPIQAGERRQGDTGVYVAKSQQKARVWFTVEGSTRTVWMGAQAWRRLPLVSQEGA
jgi:hypothetical protein